MAFFIANNEAKLSSVLVNGGVQSINYAKLNQQTTNPNKTNSMWVLNGSPSDRKSVV